MMLQDGWGVRGPSCQAWGTLSRPSPSRPSHVTPLSASKTFCPGRQSISWQTFSWHSLSRPNISLSTGQEIYPEKQIFKPRKATKMTENCHLCSFSLPSLEPGSELIMVVGNKTASFNSLYLQKMQNYFLEEKANNSKITNIPRSITLDGL